MFAIFACTVQHVACAHATEHCQKILRKRLTWSSVTFWCCRMACQVSLMLDAACAGMHPIVNDHFFCRMSSRMTSHDQGPNWCPQKFGSICLKAETNVSEQQCQQDATACHDYFYDVITCRKFKQYAGLPSILSAC